MSLQSLAYHLRHNLWIDQKLDGVLLDDSFSSHLDIAMLARRAGIPGEKTPSGILTRFEGLAVGRLLTQIEEASIPQLTNLGLLLLQISSESGKFLSSGIERITKDAERDGRNHDLSMQFDAAGAGITVHCNDLPEQVARDPSKRALQNSEI